MGGNVEKRISYITGELKGKTTSWPPWTRSRTSHGRRCRRCKCRCRSCSKHQTKDLYIDAKHYSGSNVINKRMGDCFLIIKKKKKKKKGGFFFKKKKKKKKKKKS